MRTFIFIIALIFVMSGCDRVSGETKNDRSPSTLGANVSPSDIQFKLPPIKTLFPFSPRFACASLATFGARCWGNYNGISRKISAIQEPVKSIFRYVAGDQWSSGYYCVLSDAGHLKCFDEESVYSPTPKDFEHFGLDGAFTGPVLSSMCLVRDRSVSCIDIRGNVNAPPNIVLDFKPRKIVIFEQQNATNQYQNAACAIGQLGSTDIQCWGGSGGANPILGQNFRVPGASIIDIQARGAARVWGVCVKYKFSNSSIEKRCWGGNTIAVEPDNEEPFSEYYKVTSNNQIFWSEDLRSPMYQLITPWDLQGLRAVGMGSPPQWISAQGAYSMYDARLDWLQTVKRTSIPEDLFQLSLGATDIWNENGVTCFGRGANYHCVGLFLNSQSTRYDTVSFDETDVVKIAGSPGQLCVLNLAGKVRCHDRSDDVLVRDFHDGKILDLIGGASFICAKGETRWTCINERGSRSKMDGWQVPGEVYAATEVQAGEDFLCGRFNGTVKCWSPEAQNSVVLNTPTLTNVDQVVVGTYSVCALSFGRMSCWGGYAYEGTTSMPPEWGTIRKMFLTRASINWHQDGHAKYPENSRVCVLTDRGLGCQLYSPGPIWFPFE